MYASFDLKKILIILMVFLVLQSLVGSIDIMSVLLTLPGLILGLTVHEFSHAKMADRLGDPTPERQGRITLNPLAHMDPFGMVCLVFAGFGWGKPVQIDPTYFRNPSRDNMLVALAGPISNFILAFILFLIFPFAFYFFMPGNETMNQILYTMILYAASINLSLFAFNLLPFPPLDGSKILAYFLKGKARAFLWSLERYSMYIIMILFVTNIPSMIIQPIVYGIGNYMLRNIAESSMDAYVKNS